MADCFKQIANCSGPWDCLTDAVATVGCVINDKIQDKKEQIKQGGAAGALGQIAMDEILGYLPESAQDVAKCIYSAMGYKLLVAGYKAIGGNVKEAAEMVAPYAVSCGLTEAADTLGTGPISDMLRSAAKLAMPSDTVAEKIASEKAMYISQFLAGGYSLKEAEMLAKLAMDDKAGQAFIGAAVDSSIKYDAEKKISDEKAAAAAAAAQQAKGGQIDGKTLLVLGVIALAARG